ncbi:MAG: type IV pilus twitching motility protein PilT [Deltaproteobacteria bacterium]|nr:type IV pilus twitching motility protein PilT [Deltaproteobacteria bacterium]
MIQEIATPMALADLRASRPTRFNYDGGEVATLVEVQPAPGAWRVVIHRSGSPTIGQSVSPGHVPRVEDNPPPERLGLGALGGLSNLVERRSMPPPEPPAGPAGPVPSLARELGGRAAEAVQRPSADSGRIDRLLRLMAQKGASDLHLSTGCPPLVRLHGEVLKLEDSAGLTDDALRVLLAPTIPARNREEFDRRKDTDYAYEVPGLARFRVNLFVDRNGTGAVFRRIPFEIVPPEKLGLSQEVLELCNLSKGLVLVTGPTGSGKSTTLASMVDRINSTRDDHIITIEDPIEFVHQDKRCLVNQREVRVHTDGFRQALRAALRQDPDIVLVGEMRDLETVEIAIETAETGHLVFGTLHTSTAPSTVDRIIDQFPADRQAQIRTMLSESLKGVIAQTLCKRVGGGRVGVFEVLLGTTAVANMIREAKTFQLYGLMQSNRGIGMVTLNDALLEHVLGNRIEVREAYIKAVNKSEFRAMLGNHGLQVPE